MAENKKFLDLNGLGYAIRKMDAKKADLESPALTGTPTINGEEIATVGNLPTDYVVNSAENPDDDIEIISDGGDVTITAIGTEEDPSKIAIRGENANINFESGYGHDFTSIGIVKAEAFFNADNEEDGSNSSFHLSSGGAELYSVRENGDDDDYSSHIILEDGNISMAVGVDNDTSINLYGDGNGIVFNSTGTIDYFADGDIGYTTEGSNMFVAKGGSNSFTADTGISFNAGEGVSIAATEDIELETEGIATYNGVEIATKEYVDDTIDSVNEVKLTKVVQWDNAEEGISMVSTNNMVVLTEEEYESLEARVPNTFYFIYDNEEEEIAAHDL